jgi:hypothetical protein
MEYLMEHDEIKNLILKNKNLLHLSDGKIKPNKSGVINYFPHIKKYTETFTITPVEYLYNRIKTTGINQMSLKIKNTEINLIDVGGKLFIKNRPKK